MKIIQRNLRHTFRYAISTHNKGKHSTRSKDAATDILNSIPSFYELIVFNRSVSLEFDIKYIDKVLKIYNQYFTSERAFDLVLYNISTGRILLNVDINGDVDDDEITIRTEIGSQCLECNGAVYVGDYHPSCLIYKKMRKTNEKSNHKD